MVIPFISALAGEAAEGFNLDSNMNSNMDSNRITATGKRKRGGEVELEGRQTVAKLHGWEKLDRICQIHGTIPDQRKELTNGARSFARHSDFVVNCLKAHWLGSYENFLIKHGESFKFSEFDKKCCAGGEQCEV